MAESMRLTGGKQVLNIDHLFTDKKQLARIRAEAKFGGDEIRPILDMLPDGARILEVGCGTGYLLAHLANDYPHLSFSGLEPIGQGFAQFENVLDAVSRALKNVQIFKNSIETHTEVEAKYDFVFSVNVYEHLADWRKGLDAATGVLNDHGCLVILCPNYTFPYEPHFGIPLLFGSKASRVIFARRIESMEKCTDSEGLWNSLNFITATAVAQHCRCLGYKTSFDKNITRRMVERLTTDGEFADRQGFLGKLLAMPISPARILGCLPTAILPYMKVAISKDNSKA